MSLSARGILNPRMAEQQFSLSRHGPSRDLAAFIERYWLIRWDLRGRPPHTQATLPYPCVNIVFEQEGARVWGVCSRKFEKVLEGQGSVVGIKMRPGGFRPFVDFPIRALTDGSRSLRECFAQAVDVEREVMAESRDDARISLVEAFFRSRLPPHDPNVDLVAHVVTLAESSRDIATVEDLARRSRVSLRRMQRLFREYVGVSPKWVLRRFRIHEAAQRAEGGEVRWSQLASELGYTDQSHFIRDWRAQVGMTPKEYARSNG
jgi:AraC-like DNA-binding protein